MPSAPASDHHQQACEEIAAALFASVPDDWTEIRLEIGVLSASAHRLEISGPGGTPLLRVPDDALYAAVRHLVDLFADTRGPITGAECRLMWDEASEDWEMSVEYRR